MKIVYMGTPDFAVEPLEALIKAGNEILLVVTQPDKERGRGKEVSFSPVKECALKHNIPVIQPIKIRESEWVAELRKYKADIFVVAAFGQILSKEILDMPKFGCVNIHASLLPKYRGAAPIQWCILNGERYTGVTIQKMAEGVDTGDIISQRSIEIESTDTGDSLFDKLMYLGADLIVDTIKEIEEGKATYTPQNEEDATHVGKITKEMGRIDFTRPADEIERYTRGLNSWPSAFTTFNGKILKIWSAEVSDNEANKEFEPGAVTEVTKESFLVKCSDKELEIFEVQLEGKKRMKTHDFLLGVDLRVGMVLG